MVLSQCSRSLDLSRRRVAAITFLANIQVHDESHQEGIASEDADPSDDHTITEIRLDCLQKTHVLKDFQDHKRLRHERFRGVGFKLPPTVIEPAHNVNEHEKIARKLTFGQTENKLFAEEREEEIYNSTKHLIHIDEHDEPLTPRSRNAPDKARLEVNDNLLHLDLSNVPGNQPAPRSAPPGAIPAGTNSLSSQNSKLGFNFAPEKHSSHEQLPESRNMYSSKRKLTYQNKTDEIKTFNIGSSNESLSFIPSNLGARLRKISGNLSENSSTSNRDLRAFRTDDEKPTGNERFVLVTPEKRTPFAVVSIIPFHKNSRAAHRSDRDHNKRTRTNSGARQFSLIHDGFDFNDIMLGEKLDESQETSYSHLLHPTTAEDIERREAHFSNGRQSFRSPLNEHPKIPEHNEGVRGSISCGYSPHELDGWLIAGKHRTFLPFPSYVTSVIEYVKPSELKKELNSKFKERFPYLQLSLSKLRSIKREMKRVVVVECGLDLLTVAMAYVYFEILVLKNNINKANRKFCAGACLILAAKMNDVKKADLTLLIEKIESVFRINRRDLLSTEFCVLVTLEFGLHIPSWQIFPHYQRLLYET